MNKCRACGGGGEFVRNELTDAGPRTVHKSCTQCKGTGLEIDFSYSPERVWMEALHSYIISPKRGWKTNDGKLIQGCEHFADVILEEFNKRFRNDNGNTETD